MRRSGSITVITGSMFAGKTEELIRLARRSLFAKKRVQVFKPTIDERYHRSLVVTHAGVTHEAQPVASVKELEALLLPDTQVVLIEEAQFFEQSIVPMAVRLADEGREVVLAGLDQDFRRQPFGPMPELMSVADEVIKLRAICINCGAPASHTYRVIDSRPAHIGDPIVLVGATETYEARCRACYRLRGEKKVRRKGAIGD